MTVHHPNEVPNETPKNSREQRRLAPTEAPMSLAQASYLMMLCEETDEVLDDSLTERQAADLIARLEDITGRGVGHRPRLT